MAQMLKLSHQEFKTTMTDRLENTVSTGSLKTKKNKENTTQQEQNIHCLWDNYKRFNM